MDRTGDVYACTLTDRDAAEGLDADRALADRVLHTRRTPDGVRVTLDGRESSRRLVDTFVENETRCSGFFDFAVSETEGAVVLEITAPTDEAAQRLVDEAERTFREGPGAVRASGADRGSAADDRGGRRRGTMLSS